MPRITARTLKEAKPGKSAYFIRDTELKGFAVTTAIVHSGQA